MQYTLGQAARKLATTSHAYGATDVREAINDAIQALAGLSGWECLRKVVRIVSARPAFALPQGCAGLVRACVAGLPVSVRGQDFEFLHSGPGDISRPPAGFCAVHPSNMIDRGYHPLMFQVPAPYGLAARARGEETPPPLRVKGILPDGEIRSIELEVAGRDTDPDETGISEEKFMDVLSVALDDCAASYVDLYAEGPAGGRVPVALYHPAVKAPRFRRYEIQGAPPRPVDILAEVRIDPLPMVDDAEVLPFDTLEPVEWMMQALWYTKSGEIDAAQKMHALAANWLKARETTNATVQTPVIANSLFRGSPGELSMEAVNI